MYHIYTISYQGRAGPMGWLSLRTRSLAPPPSLSRVYSMSTRICVGPEMLQRFRFRVSGFGYRVPDFEFRVSGSGLGFGCRFRV